MFMYAKSESSLNSFSPCVVTKSDTVKNDQIFPDDPSARCNHSPELHGDILPKPCARQTKRWAAAPSSGMQSFSAEPAITMKPDLCSFIFRLLK